MADGKYPDSGIIGTNKFRKTEKAPTHTGKINLSEDTMAGLIAMVDRGEEPVLKLAGWRKADNPGMLGLKVSLPQEAGGQSPVAGQRRPAGQKQFATDDFGDEGEL